MKKRTLIFSAAAILIVALAVPFAVAQRLHAASRAHGCTGGSSMMMFGRMGKAKAALGLSDQQATDIKKIFTDLQAQNEPYRTALRAGRQSIAQALLANPNDLATPQALIDKQADAERQIKVNTLAAASKALNVLTSDQRTKAAAFLQQRMAKLADK
ncbi:MAG TPA: periplasmic heavy metal sensor [Thermoanaerobaculia bacterium]|jgi:Spy/CpxP family protein refolding chaperone|nr:periplasmic heavy metal sensor [Thermoanaerobaculia bacterium]